METIDSGSQQTALAQAFGTLATRLHQGLGHASQALEPHAGVLTEGTLAELDALRAEFERRRVRIAVYGEVKAGKSTLVNAIAGAALSPVAFEPLTSVPVRITYGESTAWRVGDRPLENVAELERLMRNGLAGNGATPDVVVETDLDLLQLGGQLDLVDTPGVGSDTHFDAVTAEQLRSLDAVVLVVRYPGLFTRFTRQLTDNLQSDIGKLFVVWNLDAACAELPVDERARHAEALRANVAGAHELFLVDARAGLHAMQSEDGAGSVASGLTALIAALTRFASSSGREVTALREAAKRAHERLVDAHRRLTERSAVVEQHLADTRARLREVEEAAAAESSEARGRLAALETALTRIGQKAGADVSQLATNLRRQLRAARQRWVRRGDIAALESAIRSATARYADDVAAANRATSDAIQTAAADFGVSVPDGARPRTELRLEPLASEDRIKRATRGRGQLLRRAVWQRWYLPGLGALERAGIAADLSAQAAHVAAVSQSARDAAGTALAARLAEISQRAADEVERIKAETNFSADVAETERLSQNLPVIAAQCEAVARVGAEARSLIASA